MSDDPLRTELERLLAEPIEAARLREQSEFDRRTKSTGGKIVLFGAGGLGRRTLAGLRKVGIEPLAFADNNSSAWGNAVDGLIVLSPEVAATKYGASAAFVITIWRAGGKHRTIQFLNQLRDLGCQTYFHVGYLYWKYPAVFLPHYTLQLPSKVLEQANDVRRGLDIWADERSRREYVSQVRLRLLLDFDGLASPSPADEQYFPAGLFAWISDEVFVDVGAFDGDTLKAIVAREEANFKQIIALEPDPLNFTKMENFRNSLPENVRSKIELYPFGAGETAATISFNATGTAGSAAGSGETEIQLKPLDDLLQDVQPTFVKMDIESAEPEALRGCAHIIRTHSPILAICVYHLQDHLWQIPLWIKKISPNYRLFLRPHNEECWDLVCYAVPPDRLIS